MQCFEQAGQTVQHAVFAGKKQNGVADLHVFQILVSTDQESSHGWR